MLGFLDWAVSKGPKHGRQAAMMEVQGSIAPHIMVLTLVSVGPENDFSRRLELFNERTNKQTGKEK